MPESLLRALKRITLDTLGTSLAAPTLGSGCRAKALVNRTVILADFMPDGLRQPDVLALADRLDYAIDRLEHVDDVRLLPDLLARRYG